MTLNDIMLGLNLLLFAYNIWKAQANYKISLDNLAAATANLHIARTLEAHIAANTASQTSSPLGKA